MGQLLISISGCLRRDVEQTLVHPAVSLVRADRSLTFWDLTWAPTGDLLGATGIDYCLGGACSYRVYVIDVQAHEVRPLFKDYDQTNPAWTSNPEVISFYWYGDEDQPPGVYVVSLDDGGPQFVADGHFASWSSDGRYVAIARGRGPTTPEGYLRPSVTVADLTNDQEISVFETLQTAEEVLTGLAWSPGDDLLALSATWTNPSGIYEKIFVVSPDGTGLREVIDGGGPGWMPDGEWLYFVGDQSRLLFTPLDEQCVVAPLDIPHIECPVISPLGDQIAFVHEGNIYLLDLDQLLGPDREMLVCPD